MARSYAQLSRQRADLASDFGLDWATKLFGAALAARLAADEAAMIAEMAS